MDLGTKISNSWVLTKACFKVLVGNPQLFMFPICSVVATAVIILGFMGFTISTLMFSSFLGDGGSSVIILNVIGWVIVYYLTVFVVIFSNVAIVGSANMILDGKKPTVSDGFRIASSRIGPIIGWTILSGTVSLIIKAIQNKSGTLGKFVMGLLGIAWTIVTYFVVPIIVFEGVGPFESLKRSIAILKKIWGESLVTNFGVHMVISIAVLSLIIVMLPLLFISFSISPFMFVGVLGLLIVLIAAISIVGTTLKGILMAALYRYAKTGKTGFGISKETMKGMFAPKEPMLGRNLGNM
jgi:hypothetical protein